MWFNNRYSRNFNQLAIFSACLIDRPVHKTYTSSMDANNKTNRVSEEELRRLEIRIDELIKTCEQLKEENRLLRAQQQTYSGERATLLEKQEQARTRVEAMINRLKSLEQSQ